MSEIRHYISHFFEILLTILLPIVVPMVAFAAIVWFTLMAGRELIIATLTLLPGRP